MPVPEDQDERRAFHHRKRDAEQLETLAATILAGYIMAPDSTGNVVEFAVQDAIAIRARVRKWVETGE